MIRCRVLGYKTSDQGSITIWGRDVCNGDTSERLVQGYSIIAVQATRIPMGLSLWKGQVMGRTSVASKEELSMMG